MHVGNFPESMRQAILAGTVSVGGPAVLPTRVTNLMIFSSVFVNFQFDDFLEECFFRDTGIADASARGRTGSKTPGGSPANFFAKTWRIYMYVYIYIYIYIHIYIYIYIYTLSTTAD